MPRYPYTSWYNVCNLIQDKLMLLSTTTGASAADYTCMGDHGDMDASLWPLLVRMPYTA